MSRRNSKSHNTTSASMSPLFSAWWARRTTSMFSRDIAFSPVSRPLANSSIQTDRLSISSPRPPGPRARAEQRCRYCGGSEFTAAERQQRQSARLDEHAGSDQRPAPHPVGPVPGADLSDAPDGRIERGDEADVGHAGSVGDEEQRYQTPHEAIVEVV